MKITVYNPLPELYPLFTGKHKPADLLERYIAWGDSESGLTTMLKKMKGPQGFPDREMLSAARTDGIDVLEGQQGYGLFNPTRSLEATKWCFEAFERLQLDRSLVRMLDTLAQAMPSDLLPERLQVVILPPDCASEGLMLKSSGLSTYGRLPGYLLVRVWPTEGNLKRLGPVLVRSLIHGLRSAVRLDKGTLSLGEALVTEGLAVLWISQCFPEAAQPSFVTLAPPEDWQVALTQVAGYYGKDVFDELTFNVYGSSVQAAKLSPPKAVPMTDEEFEYACELMLEEVNRTDPHGVAAYIYGDPLLAEQGHPTFGVPYLAGFEVGARLVRDVVDRTGMAADEALSVPWQDIIRAAENLQIW